MTILQVFGEHHLLEATNWLFFRSICVAYADGKATSFKLWGFKLESAEDVDDASCCFIFSLSV
jgi:hypothetical protein